MALMTAQEVYDLLYDEDFRTAATFKVPGTDSYDPTTRTRTESSVTDHTVYVSPPARRTRYALGESVTDNEWVLYFSPYGLTFTPVKSMKIVIDSQTWFIEELNDYEGGGGSICVYEAVVRRG